MEKAIYKHSTLVVLLAHLIYSHATGLDLPKAIVGVFLVALHAYNAYLQKLEIPDIRKELRALENSFAEKSRKTEEHISALESSLSKYDAFIIKNPTSASKPLRF